MIYKGDALEYIKETPQILRNILESQDQIMSDCINYLKNKDISKIYLMGLGSSYYGAKAIYKFMENLLGVQVIPVRPNELLELQHYIDKDAVVFGISQQGTSTGVITAMDVYKSLGYRVIAVTGEYDTEITYHGDATLYIECGYEDAGATTKGYTATVFTLALLAIHIALSQHIISKEDKRLYDRTLYGLIDSMSGELEKTSDQCVDIAQKLAGSRDLIIVTGDEYKNVLDEIVLKFTETSRFPVRGFHTEDFMHGIYNAVNDDTDFLFLWDDSEYIRKIYDYYQEKGNRIFCLNKDSNGAKSIFKIILPLQQLIVMTSRIRGIDLNTPRDPDFHKIMGSKLEEN